MIFHENQADNYHEISYQLGKMSQNCCLCSRDWRFRGNVILTNVNESKEQDLPQQRQSNKKKMPLAPIQRHQIWT